MLPIRAPLFELMSARMSWLGQRQVILSENIANADTPDYQPRDLRAADFDRLVQGVTGEPGRPGRPSRLTLAQTDPGHLNGLPVARIGLGGRTQPTEYEVAPDGNAVVLEEQSAKASQTALDFQLTSNLYRKYLGMIRTALGTNA